MKALTFQAPRSVAHETVDDPTLQDPGDVLVKVEWTAICGSDLHVWRGHESGLDLGTVMGHEFLGEVVDAGAAVQSFPVGTKVVSPFTTSCGSCFYCSQGLSCRCTQGQLFGWLEGGHGLQGAQADYVRVPMADTTLIACPEDADSEATLLCGDVLATGMFCADMGDVGPGKVVAVVGCGPVGLMAIVASRELGAERILAVDTIPERLALAARFGAEPLNASDGSPLEVVRAATEGRGADSVLEAVGSPEATRAAVDLVRPGGTLAACGVHTESGFAFTPGEAYDKNLTYRAGRCPVRRYVERTLDVVRSKRYELSAIVSHRLALAEGPAAYETFDAKREGCTKVLLKP